MTKPIPETRGVEGLLQRLWSRIREPKALSVLAWTSHIILFAAGVVTIIMPPPLLTVQAGSVAAGIASSLFIVGGLLGAVGALPGWRLTERLGLAGSVMGLILCLLILLYSGVGAAKVPVIPMALAYVSMAWMASRWIRIKDSVFEPGSKAEAKAVRDNPSIRADTGPLPLADT